jgi:hypothetical protein
MKPKSADIVPCTLVSKVPTKVLRYPTKRSSRKHPNLDFHPYRPSRHTTYYHKREICKDAAANDLAFI